MWSVVGGIATSASPAKRISPTFSRLGTRSRKVFIALCAATSRVGFTSFACIEPETSSTRTTVALSLAISVFTCGRASPTHSVASATRNSPAGR